MNLKNVPYILENGSNDNTKESSVGPLLPVRCGDKLPEYTTKMNYLPSHLFEEIYFKTVITRVPYCTGVWGCCSIPMFTEIVNLHVKARRIAHKISKNCLEHEVLDLIKWQDLEYLYKRRLAIEFFKVKQDLSS